MIFLKIRYTQNCVNKQISAVSVPLVGIYEQGRDIQIQDILNVHFVGNYNLSNVKHNVVLIQLCVVIFFGATWVLQKKLVVYLLTLELYCAQDHFLAV